MWGTRSLSLLIICCPVFLCSEISVKLVMLDVSRTSVSVRQMCGHSVLPSVRSVARCQKDFRPFHRSGMDWDDAAVSQEGEK